MADGCTLLILAGGHSRRMGRDKAALLTGQKTSPAGPAADPLNFVEHLATRLTPVVEEVIVAGGRSQASLEGLRVVDDRYPGLGPLAGMHAGMQAAAYPWVWVVACDLPDVEPVLGKYMMGLADDADAVVPRLDSGPEGLCAMYRRALAPQIEKRLCAGERSVKSLLAAIKVRWLWPAELRSVDPELRSFLNINTPSDYEAWIRRR
jgi:molybdopterin-guanine dinucleotide biosynthesis protein A